MERKKIRVAAFLAIAASFFSLLLLSIVTLNVTYCTLALVLLVTQSCMHAIGVLVILVVN